MIRYLFNQDRMSIDRNGISIHQYRMPIDLDRMSIDIRPSKIFPDPQE